MARAKISTDDWEPPAGMTKRVCSHCQKPFASRGLSRCANCIATAHRRKAPADDPFLGAGQRPARRARVPG